MTTPRMRAPQSGWKRFLARMKYRRLVPGIVLSVMLLLIVTIIFNSLLVTRLSREYGEISINLHRLSTLYGKLDFSSRVFDNIQLQVKNNTPLPTDRRNTLHVTYQNHRNQYIGSLADMRARLEQLHRISHAWAAHPIIRRMGIDPGFDSSVETLGRMVAELAQLANETLPDPDRFEALSMEPLKPIHGSLPELIEDLNMRNAAHSIQSAERALMQVNLVMVTLFLAVLLLAVLLYRLLHHGMRYVETGMDLMNRHQYDPDHMMTRAPLFCEERAITDKFRNVLMEQRLVEEVKREAGRGYILQDVLEALFTQIRPILDTDRIGVAFIDRDQGRIIAEHGILHDGTIRLGPGFETDLSTSSLRDVVASGEPAITGDLREQLGKNPHSESLRLIVEEGIRSNMILPLKIGGTVFAILFLSSRIANRYSEADLSLGRIIAEELSPLLDKTFLTQTIFSRITNSFADLVDRKDNETGDHLHRMVQYSVLIAEALRTHPDPAYRTDGHFVRDIANNAASHDIGKVAIPDGILKKPGRLDPDEWMIMKTHAAVGGDIFASLRSSLRIFQQQFYAIAENIARHHHERWDGSGYPDRLSGQQIPLEARIVAVADVFDALTSKRVYKPAWTLEDSFAEVTRSAGSHLDPVLVEVFLSRREEAERISRGHPSADQAGGAPD